MAGALPRGVEVKLMPLPPDLQAEVDGVIREASNEIDRGKALRRSPLRSWRKLKLASDILSRNRSEHEQWKGAPVPVRDPLAELGVGRAMRCHGQPWRDQRGVGA